MGAVNTGGHGGGIFLGCYSMRATKVVWHQGLLRVPGVSGVLISMDTARFASTLSILMASGVPLLDALRIAGAVMANRVLRASASTVALRVQEGSSLHRALSQEAFFPAHDGTYGGVGGNVRRARSHVVALSRQSRARTSNDLGHCHGPF